MKKIGLLMMGFVIVAQAEFSRGANDLTVIDSETKLEWQDSYESGKFGKYTWSSAINYCEELELDGKDDWRLPNINELKSIIVDTQYAPSIAIGEDKFKVIGNSTYWSSTWNIARSYIWLVNFSNGSVGYNNNKNYVRCVRN